jgi:hypothetical protein
MNLHLMVDGVGRDNAEAAPQGVGHQPQHISRDEAAVLCYFVQ